MAITTLTRRRRNPTEWFALQLLWGAGVVVLMVVPPVSLVLCGLMVAAYWRTPSHGQAVFLACCVGTLDVLALLALLA